MHAHTPPAWVDQSQTDGVAPFPGLLHFDPPIRFCILQILEV